MFRWQMGDADDVGGPVAAVVVSLRGRGPQEEGRGRQGQQAEGKQAGH